MAASSAVRPAKVGPSGRGLALVPHTPLRARPGGRQGAPLRSRSRDRRRGTSAGSGAAPGDGSSEGRLPARARSFGRRRRQDPDRMQREQWRSPCGPRDGRDGQDAASGCAAVNPRRSRDAPRRRSRPEIRTLFGAGRVPGHGPIGARRGPDPSPELPGPAAPPPPRPPTRRAGARAPRRPSVPPCRSGRSQEDRPADIAPRPPRGGSHRAGRAERSGEPVFSCLAIVLHAGHSRERGGRIVIERPANRSASATPGRAGRAASRRASARELRHLGSFASAPSPAGRWLGPSAALPASAGTPRRIGLADRRGEPSRSARGLAGRFAAAAGPAPGPEGFPVLGWPQRTVRKAPGAERTARPSGPNRWQASGGSRILTRSPVANGTSPPLRTVSGPASVSTCR